MNTLLVGISLVAIVVASGCTTDRVRVEAHQGVAVHPCTKNPLLRSTGLFGGTQSGIFLSGPDLRREPPPAVDGLTRVLNVTEVDNFRDLDAEPVIDKCGSRLQSMDENEVEVTIMWRDRNCPNVHDQEDSDECHSRASFSFTNEDLRMHETLDGAEYPEAALDRLLLVDAYFTQEIQPAGRHAATGMPTPQTGNVHLVVRVIRVSGETDFREGDPGRLRKRGT